MRAYCDLLAATTGGDYAVASEHAHSNCVLIARKEFLREGVWHTHIDDEKFFDLFEAFVHTGAQFTAQDYCAPTPAWAVYNAAAIDGGFDPAETRVAGKGKGAVVHGC